jgi:hypoxanthine phosphoribosyltransferase
LTPILLSDIEQNGVISSSKRLHGTDSLNLRLIYSKEEIASQVRRLADEISRDYSGKELLLVVVLNGAFIFAADLVRMLSFPVEIDFVTLKSYSGMESCGRVMISRDLDIEAKGKHLLVVEDIIDTGITLEFLLNHLAGKYPDSLKVCTMIDKRGRRRNDITVDYAGIACESGFLVGYGLDFNEKFRELDAIYEVAELPPFGGLNDNTM